MTVAFSKITTSLTLVNICMYNHFLNTIFDVLMPSITQGALIMSDPNNLAIVQIKRGS